MTSWLPVVGWEGIYEVSDRGLVRSVARAAARNDGVIRSFAARELSVSVNSNGYLAVRLHGIGKGKSVSVHRLVALAFIPNPLGKPEVNHLDGDKTNPAVENLEWVTSRENRKHAWDTGLRNRSHLPVHFGERNSAAKLTGEQVLRMRMRRANGESYRSLAREAGVDHKTLRSAILGLTWATIPAPPKGSTP